MICGGNPVKSTEVMRTQKPRAHSLLPGAGHRRGSPIVRSRRSGHISRCPFLAAGFEAVTSCLLYPFRRVFR